MLQCTIDTFGRRGDYR